MISIGPHHWQGSAFIQNSMNKAFMEFMRKNYPEVLKSVHAKFGSVVRVEDCLEEHQTDDQPASIDMG
jgi:hypothetical protein